MPCARKHRIDESLYFSFYREIGDERKDSFASCVQFTGTGMNAVRRRSNDDAHTFGMQPPRHGKANSLGASGAGNHRCLIAQARCHPEFPAPHHTSVSAAANPSEYYLFSR